MSSVELNIERLEKMRRDVPKQTADVAENAARRAVYEMKTNMSPESPSSPGGPPGIDTGLLIESIDAREIGPGKWEVTDGVPYGAALEYGVVSRNLAARPWFVPAVFRAIQGTPSEMEEALRK